MPSFFCVKIRCPSSALQVNLTTYFHINLHYQLSNTNNAFIVTGSALGHTKLHQKKKEKQKKKNKKNKKKKKNEQNKLPT